MYIMGLGGSLHDFSACIVSEKGIEIAIEEERLNRIKHSVNKKRLEKYIKSNQLWKYINNADAELLSLSINYCLDGLNITLDDIDYIVTTDSNIWLPFVKKLENLVVINHHLSHAASTFYTSNFNESAILVIDGQGSEVNVNGKIGYETITLAYGNKNKIKVIKKIINYSLGHFYSMVTMAIGFGFLEEGKTMGLSSYGIVKENIFSKYYILKKDGEFEFKTTLKEIETEVKKMIEKDNSFENRANLALCAQKTLYEIVIHILKYFKSILPCENLCIAGGVGLNSVLNGQIFESNIYNNVFVFPASGDNGLSIGCALYGLYVLSNNKRS